MKRSLNWRFEEGRKRERAAILRLLRRISKAEVNNADYAGLLRGLTEIIKGRK